MRARVVQSEEVYAGWTNLSRVQLQMPDGAVLERHIEDHGPGVTVLPYDPVSKTAILVSMPRASVVVSGEADLLEAVAGALENEAPEECARREAWEEAGIKLHELEKVAEVWSMPSLSKERIHLYLAAFSAADRRASGGGAEGEHENITVHEVSLAELWNLAAEGRLTDMKTLLLVHALKVRKPELF